MGVEVAFMAAVAVASTGAKMRSEYLAEQAQEEALQTQAQEQMVQYQQKTISNYDLMQKVLDKQEAALSVSGVAANSPSFNAIQRQTLNTGAQQLRNDKLENDVYEANIATERANVRSKLWAQMFGDVSSLAMQGVSFAGKIPTSGSVQGE